ncbi:MAG: hypothetical protein E7371_03145 [Clostridiales bacterium]|nr:hypothetical protein [Clostridiales bacterium]
MANFTQEQMRAIEAQGKTIVSASAGSGKTTVMIEKIIRLIKDGAGVGEILAVTFTKKAAAQMKEKLCKELIEEINRDSTDSARRERMKKQLSEVPGADISTIHSFCAKLLRSHFYLAGVDSAFRVIGGDDAEGTALKNAALDELLEEGYEQKEENFAYLLSLYWRKKSDRGLREIFTKVYEELRNRADYRAYLENTKAYTEETFNAICADLKKKLDEKCRYYYDLVENERAYFMFDEKNAAFALCNELLSLLDDLIYAEDYFASCAVVKPKFSINRKSKNDSEETLLHRERLGFLKDRITKIVEDELGKTLSRKEELENFLQSGKTAGILAEYLLRFDEKYERLKAERCVVDYNDLEHKALGLLGNEDVAKEMQEKYRYVFVDEYQDVNPVQEALISRLSGENLFLVGDVKQAIYGFRGSKSRFFVEKQNEFEKNGGSNLFMTRNFRSSDQVLDAVNLQFSLAMTPQVCSVDYARDSRMEKGGRYALNSGKVCVHFLGKEEKEPVLERGIYSVKQQANREMQEESTIAKLIRSIIEEERRSQFYDPDKGEYREVRYSDIAVLSRKKQGQIARTVESLSAEGVPVTAAAAINVCDFSEVKMLMDLLSLIDNEAQDIPLCSVLLSPVGGLTADDLTAIRLAYREETFFRAACRRYANEMQDALAVKLAKFFAYFEQVRTLSRVLDAGELLTRIITETRMEATLLARVNGVAALRRMHRFIEEASNPDPLCVHEFLDRLRDLDYKIEYSENGGEDSVKVLTMHSSKGLEYPIVILDNLSTPFRKMDADEVFVEERYGLAPRAFDSVNMVKRGTVLRRLHEIAEAESSIADDLNLYYVALTRAKYGLHMIFEKSTVMADVKYARSFAEFTDFSVWKQYVVEDTIFDVPKQERTPLVFRPDETLAREIMEAFLWQYPHTGCENLPVKSSATDLMSAEETETPWYDGGSFDKKANTGREIGVAYHAFLERFDFSLLYDEQGDCLEKTRIADVVSAWLEKQNEGGMVGLNLLSVEKLTEILSNSVFRDLRGKRLYKEQKFLVNLPADETYVGLAGIEGEQIIFQGAIDLLAVGEDGDVQIIDYKYSKGSAEYLTERYQTQLYLYRKAVAKILRTDESRIRCSIVNICQGFQVNLD